jgi:hypothetical protein
MNFGAIAMLISRPALSSLTVATFLALSLAAPPAGAQAPRPGQAAPPPGPAQRGQPPQPAPPKPYTAVPVTLPQPSTDPSFEAFRKQIGDIASRKDRAALGRLVANNFFWLGQKGDKANRRKSGVDNLAAAIALDNKDGSGWQLLTEAAGEATMEPMPQKRGVMCSPASPMFDEAAADKVAKATGTEPEDWGYPSKAGVEVREAPKADAPVIDTLGLNLVRVMPEEPPAGAPEQDSPFVRVVTPSGKVGYVPDELLSSLDIEQLCYIKDASGWKIAGYAGNE